MLEVDGLAKRYGDVLALRELTVRVEEAGGGHPRRRARARVRPAIADVHDGIAVHLEARGLSSLAGLPRHLPRD